MRGIIVNSEKVALGGAPRRMEWGDVRKKSQCMRQGGHMQKGDGWRGSYKNGHGKRDQAGITEHLDGAGWRQNYERESRGM